MVNQPTTDISKTFKIQSKIMEEPTFKSAVGSYLRTPFARLMLVLIAITLVIGMCSAQSSVSASLTYEDATTAYCLEPNYVVVEGDTVHGYWAGDQFWSGPDKYQFWVDGYTKTTIFDGEVWYPTVDSTGAYPTLYEVLHGYDRPLVERFPAPVLGIWKSQEKAARHLFWAGVALETAGFVLNGWHAAEMQFEGHHSNWDRADLLGHARFAFIGTGTALSAVSFTLRHERYRRPTLRGVGEGSLHFIAGMLISQASYRFSEKGYK